MANKDGLKFSYAISLATQLGFLISASIAGFLVLGFWIDEKLGTSPLFLLAGIVIGISLTIVEVYHMIRPLVSNDDDNDDV